MVGGAAEDPIYTAQASDIDVLLADWDQSTIGYGYGNLSVEHA
jgi:hypothetical protein